MNHSKFDRIQRKKDRSDAAEKGKKRKESNSRGGPSIGSKLVGKNTWSDPNTNSTVRLSLGSRG